MKTADGAEDQSAFATAETEWRGLDAKIKRAQAIENAERLEAGEPIHGETDPQLRAAYRDFSIRKMIAHRCGFDVDAGREIEMQAELQRRAGKPAEGFYVPTEALETRVGTTASNGQIVSDDYRPEQFINALTNSTVMSQMGATVLTGLTGDVILPRETGSPNVGWVNENEALSTSDASFDTVSLSPHHVGGLSEFSRQMVMQSSPDIERLLRNMLARDIALEIDRAAINGSGTGAEPRGILNDPGVPTVAFDTDLFTTTADMIAAADLANVADTRSFLATNGIKADAMKLRDLDGRPISMADTFHSEPVRFTNQAPNDLGAGTDEHALIYGDWRDFLIGVWSQLDVLVNPYAESAYSKGNLLIRAMATVDFAVRRPASFSAATGVIV
ncbi:major capsid protein [Erythrobacter sp. QSSC1-22B]|nr:major capsid protein [Erythrobacter sp. QSSC1-22B]